MLRQYMPDHVILYNDHKSHNNQSRCISLAMPLGIALCSIQLDTLHISLDDCPAHVIDCKLHDRQLCMQYYMKPVVPQIFS